MKIRARVIIVREKSGRVARFAREKRYREGKSGYVAMRRIDQTRVLKLENPENAPESSDPYKTVPLIPILPP